MGLGFEGEKGALEKRERERERLCVCEEKVRGRERETKERERKRESYLREKRILSLTQMNIRRDLRAIFSVPPFSGNLIKKSLPKHCTDMGLVGGAIQSCTAD